MKEGFDADGDSDLNHSVSMLSHDSVGAKHFPSNLGANPSTDIRYTDSPPPHLDSPDDDSIDPDFYLDTMAFFEQLASEAGVDAKILKEGIRICAACKRAFIVKYSYNHDCYGYSLTQQSFMPPFPPEKIQYNTWKYYTAVWNL